MSNDFPIIAYKFYYFISENSFILAQRITISNDFRIMLTKNTYFCQGLQRSDNASQQKSINGLSEENHYQIGMYFAYHYNISIDRNRMKQEKLLPFILVLLFRVCTTQYSVSISSPFLLTNNQVNIVTVEIDLLDSYLVSFQDGQARRYSNDFSTFTALYVPQIVQKFGSFALRLDNIQLTNNTIFTMISNMTTTLSNNFTTLRVYTYPAFAQFQSYNFTQPIINYQGLPLFTSSLDSFHILVFNQTTKVIYKGIITTAFDVNQSFGSFNVAVVFKEYVLAYGGNFVNLTYVYIHKLSTLGLIEINITLSFKYNYTSSTYDLSISSSSLITNSLSMNVQTMLVANQLVLMQMQNISTLRSYGKFVNFIDYFDLNILNNRILDFFYVFNTYYVLFTNGLITLSIDEVSGAFLFSTLVNTLPNNLYQLTFGVSLDILFVPGTPYIYKAKCLNQTAYSAGICVSYSCAVANCGFCPLTANTCETCANGFTRTDNYTCIGSTANITATNSSLTTNNTSSPANSTSFSSQGQDSTYYSLFPYLNSLGPLFSGMLNGTKIMMSVPSLRSVSPTFYFFANFDDLYLYSFHDRFYGNVMNQLFNELNALQSTKWSLFSYENLLNIFGISNTSFFQQINYQNAYISYHFSTPDLPEQSSEAIFVNCTNFFIVTVPLIIIIFIVFRIVFRFLFHYPVSKIFRKFDIWGCLFIILFDGNIQQFAFYSTSEWKNIFFFSFGDKWTKVCIVCFGFILVAVSVGGFLIAFGMYGKLNRHLVDNNRNSLRGVYFLLLQNGLRNFLFGMLHSALRPLPYMAIIVVLLSAELLFTLLFVLSFTFRIYKNASFMWFTIIISLIRILLIATLVVDYGMVNQEVIENVQCTLIVFMLLTYLIGTFAATSAFFVQTLKAVGQIIKNKPIKEQPEHTLNHINVIFFPSITPQMAQSKPINKDKMGRFFMKRKPKGQSQITLNNRILRVVQVQGGIRRYKTRTII